MPNPPDFSYQPNPSTRVLEPIRQTRQQLRTSATIRTRLYNDQLNEAKRMIDRINDIGGDFATQAHPLVERDKQANMTKLVTLAVELFTNIMQFIYKPEQEWTHAETEFFTRLRNFFPTEADYFKLLNGKFGHAGDAPVGRVPVGGLSRSTDLDRATAGLRSKTAPGSEDHHPGAGD